MTTVIKLSDVSKRFVIRKEKSLKERVVNFGRSQLHKDDFWALSRVTLDIQSGSTVGLIGPNGSGKSTLLKTIGGILQPTSGRVERRGRLAALLELGAGFHPDLTGRENVFLNAAILGLSRRQIARHFDAIVDFSGIERFIDTQVKFYSSGMYVRLAFAVAVHVDPDVLLVDEVLAVGDEPFQRKCMNRIRTFQAEGRTIVLVTHALDQVGELCDRAVVLENGRVVLDGEPRDALRVLRDDYESARLEELAKPGPAETALSDEATPAPHTRGRVVSVSCQGPRSETSATPVRLSPGDDLTLHVTVESPERLDDWILGVGIDTPLGQVVYGTHTGLLGVSLPRLTGRTTVSIDLPNLQLGEGQYFVAATIADSAARELDRLDQAASFTVETQGRSIGVLSADARIRVPSVVEDQ